MVVLDVLGVPVAVDDGGPAGVSGTRSTPALVWGHGLTSGRDHEDEAALFPLGPALAEAGVRLVRYDAPGHGASGGTADDEAYRWDRLAVTMLGVADAVGLDRCALGGASMGCATALFAALAAPGRVTALVLAVPPTAWDQRPAQADLYRAAAAVVEADGPSGLARLVRSSPPPVGYGTRGADLLETSAAHLECMDAGVLAHVLRGAAASDLPPVEAVVTIDVPTLVLALAGDPTHPLATAEALALHLPAAELVVARDVDGVGRWPDRVARFLAHHAGARTP